MNSIKEYVVSSSLQAAEWENSEIVSGDAAQKLTDVKAQDGGDITMSGSATTVRWLLRGPARRAHPAESQLRSGQDRLTQRKELDGWQRESS